MVAGGSHTVLTLAKQLFVMAWTVRGWTGLCFLCPRNHWHLCWSHHFSIDQTCQDGKQCCRRSMIFFFLCDDPRRWKPQIPQIKIVVGIADPDHRIEKKMWLRHKMLDILLCLKCLYCNGFCLLTIQDPNLINLIERKNKVERIILAISLCCHFFYLQYTRKSLLAFNFLSKCSIFIMIFIYVPRGCGRFSLFIQLFPHFIVAEEIFLSFN